ncbi:MAG TPA: carotenoid 1,2-hydratase [Burkholderiaceae bacterium]|nr:carotenoid 1,2-hydratase [Burkholderiaceae bacterium]
MARGTAARHLRRRDWLAALAAGWLGEGVQAAPATASPTAEVIDRPGHGPRPLRFPADFGAHPAWHTEWWYVTGWLADEAAAPAVGSAAPQPSHGFQLTFFRQRTDLGGDSRSAFAARQLIFAHAAVTDLGAKRLRHDQRIARAGFGLAEAALGDAHVHLHAGSRWSLRREGGAPTGTSAADLDPSVYRGRVDSPAAGFRLDLDLTATQPMLLQGQAGWSRKGPQPAQASFYTSQPQLAVRARLALDGQPERALAGRAWLDHEWSETLLDADAAGWDWIGMDLFDGSALTAFRLRRRDAHPAGPTLWAGGSWRAPGRVAQAFAPGDVRFTPRRHWTSPRHGSAGQPPVRYPVEWAVDCPAGRFIVRALLDDQELDSRASTGTVYWEGLSELLEAATGRRVGLGYLEMTGYVGRLRL